MIQGACVGVFHEIDHPSAIPVSCVKAAVHALGISCHRLVQTTNYIECQISLTIHYCKNIYPGTGSGKALVYLGLFKAGLSGKVVGNVSDLSSFADLPSLLQIHYYQG